MLPSVTEAKSPFEYAADIWDPQPDPYERRPVEWVNERLNEFIWSKQQEILRTVMANRYTAVPSCHDSGKSFIVSRLAGHWLDTWPVGSAFVVTTAPTVDQVRAVLWREIAAMHEKGGLRGRITLDAKWYMGADGNRLVAYGRKPADYNQAAFQGIHARYPLIIIDEAGGVSKTLYEAVDSLATNENARVVAIGNPDDPSSYFATVCKPGSGWKVIHIDGYETPNFTNEKIPDELRPMLLSKTWVEERKKRWGEGSPIFESKVRGRFPKISDDTLIEPGWILRAQHRWSEPDSPNRQKHPQAGPVAFGADIARLGTSETVVYLREGNRARLVHSGHKDRTTTTSGHIKRLVRAHPHKPVVYVDDSGIGGAVTDNLIEDRFNVVPLNGGTNPVEPERFGNARSEWYWNLRERFEKDEIDIDPEDEDLAAQLGSLKYKVDRRGKIWVETKEEMRKRRMPSPDRADGLCYAFNETAAWIPDTSQERLKELQEQSLTGDLMTKGF